MSHPWYKTTRWHRRRLTQLRREPLCRYCQAGGYVVPATVADHVVPHRGDAHLFWHGPLQSLCAQHHSRTKQAEEGGRLVPQVGLDGYPVGDPTP